MIADYLKAGRDVDLLFERSGVTLPNLASRDAAAGRDPPEGCDATRFTSATGSTINMLCTHNACYAPSFASAGFDNSEQLEVSRRDSGVNRRGSGVSRRDSGVNRRDSGINQRDSGVNRRDSGVNRRDSGVNRPDGEAQPVALSQKVLVSTSGVQGSTGGYVVNQLDSGSSSTAGFMGQAADPAAENSDDRTASGGSSGPQETSIMCAEESLVRHIEHFESSSYKCPHLQRTCRKQLP